jgi:DNA mismatch repair ATPase MutL
MADHSYPVEVQSDFLEKITRAKPVQALAEFIWNSLDADATAVDVRVEYNAPGTMSKIIVIDNGTGMEFAKAFPKKRV